MTELLLSVRNPNDLDKLTSFVHDAWFDIDSILFDEEHSIVEIPFVREVFELNKILSGVVFKKMRLPTFRHVLRINHVEEYRIEDTEKIGSYDMIDVEFDSTLRCVKIVTGVPLKFELMVRRLKVALLRGSQPISYRTIRSLGGTGSGLLF